MKKITKEFIVKAWNELTEEEKEKEIKKHDKNIMMDWSNYCYECFKFDIEEVKSELKYLTFDNVYVDENSQGFWIEKIEGFKISLYNKRYDITGIDFKISKFIEKIECIEYEDTDNGVYDYFESIEEMEQKHGFKQLAKELKKDVKILIDGVNEAVKTYYDEIYDVPSEYIEDYFDGFEFEYEIEKEGE